MLKKLFIIPWVGNLPPWFKFYENNILRYKEFGFDWLVINDIDKILEIVNKKLGIIFDPFCDKDSTNPFRKVCDLRPMFGYLFNDLLKGYDFWGHTDIDVVYGRIDKFVTDDLLNQCDIFSCDPNTLCGPFTLYRNIDKINNLFRQNDNWKLAMKVNKPSGFDESGSQEFDGFSQLTHGAGLRIIHKYEWQSNHYARHEVPLTMYPDGTLIDMGRNVEILFYHFNQTNKWPFSN